MSDETKLSQADLLARIEQSWNDFNIYIDTLTEAQMTTPTDAVGWTAKDHIIHLAVWEDGIEAMLQKLSRPERMGVDAETWASRDIDKINHLIFQQRRGTPLPEVLKTFRDVHQRLVARIQTLNDDDLYRPYREFQPESPSENPVINWIIGDTYDHYPTHQPWIAAIVGGSK